MLNGAGEKVKQTGFLIVLSLMLSGAGCFMLLAIKRNEAISYLDQSLADVPLYAHATLVYSGYYGCLKPENESVVVMYATNDYQGWISKSDPLVGRCEIGQWEVLKP